MTVYIRTYLRTHMVMKNATGIQLYYYKFVRAAGSRATLTNTTVRAVGSTTALTNGYICKGGSCYQAPLLWYL